MLDLNRVLNGFLVFSSASKNQLALLAGIAITRVIKLL